MRVALRTLRFFWMVPPTPRTMWAALPVAVLAGWVALMVDPAGSRAAMGPVLLVLVLSSASGFAASARRGHYDVILTGGDRRLWIGVSHWLLSAAPGLAGWLAVAAFDAWRNGLPSPLLSSGTLLAVGLVATLPWAVTVSLPRLTGGIAWLLLFTTVAAIAPHDVRAALSTEHASDGSAALSAWVVLACPWVLVGRDLGDGPALPVVMLVGTAAAAIVLALVWIRRADYPLKAAS